MDVVINEMHVGVTSCRHAVSTIHCPKSIVETIKKCALIKRNVFFSTAFIGHIRQIEYSAKGAS